MYKQDVIILSYKVLCNECGTNCNLMETNDGYICKECYADLPEGDEDEEE